MIEEYGILDADGKGTDTLKIGCFGNTEVYKFIWLLNESLILPSQHFLVQIQQ